MTDIVVLSPCEPSAADFVTALEAVAARFPELRVAGSQHFLALVDSDHQTAMTVDAARFVQVPCEATRLLGFAVDSPRWWVETRAGKTDRHLEIQNCFVQALAVASSGLAVGA